MTRPGYGPNILPQVLPPSPAHSGARSRICDPAAIIPHGVDPDAFTLRSTHSNSADRYLLYLGRFTPDKGIPHAIATARAVGLPLVLAGPENPFFQAEIKPLVDGDRVRYIGSVAGAQRDATARRRRSAFASLSKNPKLSALS